MNTSSLFAAAGGAGVLLRVRELPLGCTLVGRPFARCQQALLKDFARRFIGQQCGHLLGLIGRSFLNERLHEPLTYRVSGVRYDRAGCFGARGKRECAQEDKGDKPHADGGVKRLIVHP